MMLLIGANIDMDRSIIFLMIVFIPVIGKCQVSAEEVAKANNPLANAKALNLQNYYIPSIYEDANLKSNTTLIRYSMPLAKGKILMRFTLPLNTLPSGYDNNGKPTYASGLGDFNFFATYTLSKPTAKTMFGIGPQVAMPTGSNEFTGSGKWQVGGALILFNASSPVFQWGGLLTYQTSVAGQEDRPDASSVAIQPFLLFNWGRGPI